MVYLQKNDEIALVVPVDRKEEGKSVESKRKIIKESIMSHVSKNLSTINGLNTDERAKHFNDIVREGHIVKRDGRSYCEFPVV